jgi:DNA-binding response OmpR family regulator
MPMAAILLIDVRETLSSELVQFLRSRQHSVSVCPTVGAAIKDLRASRSSYDVVILNMSHNHGTDWKTLEEIHQFLQFNPIAPPILCLSTVYWGPRMQLDIERKGARFVCLQ